MRTCCVVGVVWLLCSVASAGRQSPAAGTAHTPAEPDLAQLLERTGDYVAGYIRSFSGMVAEERYEQVLKDAPGARGKATERILGTRLLRSDFLLVRPPDETTWTPFRDVFEVNGEAVRDREERLQKLFLQAAPASAIARAERISDESSRYNLGDVNRTINVPTLPLRFLERENQVRFAFERRRHDTIDGVDTWRIDYRERVRPTFIRTSRAADGRDVPASGSVWIEAATGRVVRTEIDAQTDGAKTKIVVTYRPNPSFDLWVPSEMKELYEYEDRVLTAVATYSRFRRFQVTTEENIKIPK